MEAVINSALAMTGGDLAGQTFSLSCNEKSLRGVFWGYFNNEMFTDVSLISAEGHVTKVHKTILCASSSYIAVS